MKEIQTNEAENDAFLTLKDLCGTSVMRFEGNDFLWANDAAKNQYKLVGQDLSYLKRSMFFVNYEDYMNLMAKLSAYGFVRDHRCLMKRTDHSSFWANISSVQKNNNGQIIFEDMVTDISHQVTLEQQLRETKLLLAKVGEELDRFIYRASHDLRGPICSAKGLICLMKHQKDSSNSDLLYMMEDTINKLDANVVKLSEISRNTNAQLNVEPIALGQLIHLLVHQFRFHANFNKIKFDIQVDDSCHVFSDKAILQTILQHLIENCLDFCDTLKKRSFVNINIIITREYFIIEILDNGIGINKSSLPHVFQLFYRGTIHSKGSGLGLYIAREATIKLGGNIELNSEIKVGTSLRICLPQLVFGQ